MKNMKKISKYTSIFFLIVVMIFASIFSYANIIKAENINLNDYVTCTKIGDQSLNQVELNQDDVVDVILHLAKEEEVLEEKDYTISIPEGVKITQFSSGEIQSLVNEENVKVGEYSLSNQVINMTLDVLDENISSYDIDLDIAFQAKFTNVGETSFFGTKVSVSAKNNTNVSVKEVTTPQYNAIASTDVASIGDEGYSTLQDAIDAVGDDGTILLLKDINENVSSTNKNYTLDMQDHTIRPAEGSTERIYTITGGTVILKNGTITEGNTADIGAGLAVFDSSLKMNNVIITNNKKTSGVAGGMYIDNSDVEMVDCTVSKNVSISDCGGILLRNGASLKGNNLTVSENKTTDSGTWGAGISTEGSSLSDYCSIELMNSNIVNNTAVGSGGGIYAVYSTMSFTNTHIDNNTAGSNGGAIATDTRSSKNNLGIEFKDNCTVSNNKAASGGAIHVTTENFSAKDTVIKGNVATKSDAAAAAGIYVKSSPTATRLGNIVLENVEVTDNKNTSSNGTGGMYFSLGTNSKKYATLTLKNCQILRNVGNSYSGAYVRVHSNQEVSALIENCTFEENTLGDTIYLDGDNRPSSSETSSSITTTRYYFKNCRIENNSATSSSKVGGINAPRVNVLSLEDTVITGNTGYDTGGVLGKPHLISGAIYGNVCLDANAGNDLKIPYNTNIKNELSVLSANNMIDSNANFSDYIWKDYQGYKLNSEITMDSLKNAIGDNTAPSYFYFTSTPDRTRYVAEIGDNQYESIAEAIAAADEDDIIRLIAGENDNSGTLISENVTISKKVQIDLNGRTLSSVTGNAIEIETDGNLTLVGVKGGTIKNRYDSTYQIINKGSLNIDDSLIQVSGIDNQNGTLTLCDNLNVTTVNNNGELSLSDGVEITTLNQQGELLSINKEANIETLNVLSGDLEVISNADIGTINHSGETLVLKNKAIVDTVVHNGTSFVIGAGVNIQNVTLGKDKYIIADEQFNPVKLTIKLDSNELKGLNTWGEKIVKLIVPKDGTSLSNDLLDKIVVSGINGLVSVEIDSDEIVAKTIELNGIFIDGVNGDNDNSGTHDNPVKTFARAKEILEIVAPRTRGVFDDEINIYIMNTVTITEGETWSLDGYETVRLKREPSFTGTLVVVNNNAQLTLDHITIDGMGQEGTKSSGALIHVDNGGNLIINIGAVLTNNNRSTGYGGAVFAEGTVTMNDGEVSYNNCSYGAGIGLRGQNASLIMNGGSINNNIAENDGGGVAVLESSQMEMTGGTISSNQAHWGGGISIGGSTTTTVGNGNAKLTMNGGVIDNNVSRAEGGGIFIQSANSASINAGTISRNISKSGNFGGGGIYVNGTRTTFEGNKYDYGMLYLTNAIITGNSAERGGGLAGCSTSTVKIYYQNGAYIYKNEANNGANQIFISSTDYGIGNPEYQITEYMPNGEPYNWSNQNDEQLSSYLLRDTHKTIYLKNNIVESNSAEATVKIIQNTAANGGGGIGTNGFVQIGEPGGLDISVTKSWNDLDNQDNTRPQAVKVWLMRKVEGDEEFEKVAFLEFSKQNDESWPETLSFTNQPEKDTNGKTYIYTVEEETTEGYVSTVEENDNGFTVTNHLSTNISGVKIWDDDNNQYGIRPKEITILIKDGEDIVDEIILSAGDNGIWEEDELKYTSIDLPKYRDGQEIEYTVTEAEVDGYITTIDGYNITNTVIPPIIDVEDLTDLVIYKTDQDYNFITGATFTLNKVVNGKETKIETIEKGPRFIFKDLDDGTYRIYETKAPNRYEGLDTYFEIEIVDNIIYYENEITDSFTVVNTNDGTEAMVLGDVIDDEDYQVWVEASEKANKAETSDNLRVMEFGLLACLSIVLIYVFLKKKMSE